MLFSFEAGPKYRQQIGLKAHLCIQVCVCADVMFKLSTLHPACRQSISICVFHDFAWSVFCPSVLVCMDTLLNIKYVPVVLLVHLKDLRRGWTCKLHDLARWRSPTEIATPPPVCLLWLMTSLGLFSHWHLAKWSHDRVYPTTKNSTYAERSKKYACL